MKYKRLNDFKILAAMAAAVGIVALGAVHNYAAATQDRDQLARKRAVATKATGDCTLYGSGCLAWPNNLQHGIDGNPATADVLIAGDSIITGCRPYLRLRLADYGLSVVFDYWSGRPTTPTVDRMLSYSRIYQPESFKAVVMATGTNDIQDPTVMAAQIARAKVIDSPLMWGTVLAQRSASYSADLRNSGWVNSQIAASGLPLIDWAAFLSAYPGYRIPNYLRDGVHPTVKTPPAKGDLSGCDSFAAIYAPRIAVVAR